MALDRLTKIDGGGISTTSDYRVGVITASKFVGPIDGVVTGSLTGTATTAVNAQGLIGTPNITVGILTASSANFSGNVTIGGTLTYEDVTNIDSVGIITARDGIDCNADLDVDGHTNLDNVSIAGVSTFSDEVNIIQGKKINFGNINGTNGYIYYDGSTTRFQTNHGLNIGAPVVSLKSANLGEVMLDAIHNGAVKLYYDYSTYNDPKLETTATGINVTGGAVFTSTDAGSAAEPEVVLYRNSASPADADYLGQIKFNGKSDTGAQRTYAKMTGKILDASNGTEDGIIEFAHIKAGSQNISARFRSDSLQLLNSTNLTVDGDIDADGDLDVDGHTELDNVRIAGVATFNQGGSEVVRINSGGLLLYNDLSFFGASTHAYWDHSANQFKLNDNTKLSVGSSSDLQIFHDGTANNNVISGHLNSLNIRNYDTNSTNINLSARNDILLQTAINESAIWCDANAGVHIYYNGAQKFVTTNTGAVISGICTATSFSGDGSNLTGITQTTINNNADNRIITGSGTANTLEGEANLTWDGATLQAVGSDAQIRLYDNTASSDNSAFRMMAYNGVNHIQSGKAFTSDSKADLIFGSMFGGTEWARIAEGGEVLIGGIRTSNTGFGNKVLISGGTLGLDGNGSNIGMHFHRNSGDTEGYIGIGPWAVTGGTDDDFGFAAKGDLLFGTSSSTWAQKMRVADNGRVKIGTGAPKAQLDIKQQGNSWEDALLIQHDNANTGWNIHAERTNSALWFGYNSNTGSALADQTASQVLHLNSNRTISTVISNNSYELTIGGISGGPTLFLRDSGTTGTSRILFGSSGGALDGGIYYKTDSNYMAFYTNGTEHVRINQSGHLIPISDASRDLGTSSLRWRNVYTTDLQLSNENTGGNEVDGTEGNWTLQEGETDVYMINRKTGKKYKMMLKEVD